MSLGIKSSAFLRVFTMGSWIHDGLLYSWNPCVKDFRILDLLESIIGFNKCFVQWEGITEIKRWISIWSTASMFVQVFQTCWKINNTLHMGMSFLFFTSIPAHCTKDLLKPIMDSSRSKILKSLTQGFQESKNPSWIQERIVNPRTYPTCV